MIDNEIIKALELCGTDSECDGCPCYTELGCDANIHLKALDLINRQKAEIDHFREVTKKIAESIKTEFYAQFDELIPSIMADRIDEIVKELREVKEND